MAQIRVQLLGGFAAFGPNGRPLALPTRKAEAVLALLACRSGEAQPRERVIGLLWGDRSDKQARHSLSQTLSSIRRAIGDTSDPFVAERESLAINPDVVSADVIDLVTCAARGELESLRAAADLCRGPLLEGFRLPDAAFDEWLSQEQARFHHIGLAVLTRLAEREAAAGDAAAAASALERALGLDPLSEDSHRRLMRLHLDRGNYNAVIRHYRECSEVLKRELGTVPEPATTALYREARAKLRDAPQPAGDAPPGDQIVQSSENEQDTGSA
jgi:DNA-binding SARP family transcriptional activator